MTSNGGDAAPPRSPHQLDSKDTLAAPAANGPPEAHATDAGGQGLAAAAVPEQTRASNTQPNASKAQTTIAAQPATQPPLQPSAKATPEQGTDAPRAATTTQSAARQASTINDLDPRRERRIDPRERTRQWVEALELPPELEAKMRSTSFKESSVQLGSAKQSQTSVQRGGWLCCFKS